MDANPPHQSTEFGVKSGSPKSYRLQRFMCWLGILPFGASALIFIPMFLADLLGGRYKEASETAENALAGVIGGGICAGIIPGLLAILLTIRLVRIRRLEKSERDVFFQDRILELAATSGGRLTTVELATQLDISTADATRWLEYFMGKGLAKLQVSESGVLVYHFDQIISPDEKNQAETV